jgi:hypothetical protein
MLYRSALRGLQSLSLRSCRMDNQKYLPRGLAARELIPHIGSAR